MNTHYIYTMNAFRGSFKIYTVSIKKLMAATTFIN